MTEKLDAIIFGATGFTGQIVVEHANEIFNDLKWGIAGRNISKLENVLKKVGAKIDKDLSQIPIIIADVTDEKSIELMAAKCKIILNCCGPYRFYGEVVVKACIDAGTHHVDISGEPQFIDRMQLKYNDLAKEKGSYVVSACGFDSIPAEMGVVFTERNFPGVVNSIEMYWENSVDYKDKHSKALLHSGTWESAIYTIKYLREMLKLKSELSAKTKLPKLEPVLRIKPYIQNPSILSSYFIPIHAGDRDSVLRSQQLRYEFEQKRPVQFESYIGFASFLVAALIPFRLLFIAILAQFSLTRKFLLRHPPLFTAGIITHQGPTEANMKAHHFSMTFYAKGWSEEQKGTEAPPKKQLLARVSGNDPFYGLTSVTLLFAAKTILEESHKMPGSGGVITPGAAFAKTSLIDELRQHKNGLKFEVMHLN